MRKVYDEIFHFQISTNLEYQLDHGDVAERARVNLGSLLPPVVENLTGPPVEAQIIVGQLLTLGPRQWEVADCLSSTPGHSELDLLLLQTDQT